MDETVFSKITEQTYNYSSKDFKPAVASVYSELRNMPSHGGYFCAQEGSSDEIVMPPMLLAGMMEVYTDECTIRHGTLNKVM